MNSYLLALLGVILLGVLIDVILPSGSTSKYIMGIFSIFVMFSIISPIVTWVKKDYNISDYFTSVDIQLNQQLLYNINNSKLQALETDIEQSLYANGYEGVEIDIQFSVVADDVEIKQVLADISNLVINNKSANINKYVYIRQAIMKHLAVSEEVIVFCE